MVNFNKKGVSFFLSITLLVTVLFIFTSLFILFADEESVDDAKKHGALISAIDKSYMKSESVNFFLDESVPKRLDLLKIGFFRESKIEINLNKNICIDGSRVVWYKENFEGEKNCILRLPSDFEKEILDYFENGILDYINHSFESLKILDYDALVNFTDEENIYELSVVYEERFREVGTGSFNIFEEINFDLDLDSEFELINFFSNENNFLNIKSSIFEKCNFLDFEDSCYNGEIESFFSSQVREDYEFKGSFVAVNVEDSFGFEIEIIPKFDVENSIKILLIYSE